MAERIAKRTIVRQTTHPSDSRPNIPTAELESFARPEEKRPATVRYPRDPTLDPQLVWKGKDEQDAHDLEVPAVPIYIGETIDPLALVEELRAESEGRRSEQQLGRTTAGSLPSGAKSSRIVTPDGIDRDSTSLRWLDGRSYGGSSASRGTFVLVASSVSLMSFGRWAGLSDIRG